MEDREAKAYEEGIECAKELLNGAISDRANTNSYHPVEEEKEESEDKQGSKWTTNFINGRIHWIYDKNNIKDEQRSKQRISSIRRM